MTLLRKDQELLSIKELVTVAIVFLSIYLEYLILIKSFWVNPIDILVERKKYNRISVLNEIFID